MHGLPRASGSSPALASPPSAAVVRGCRGSASTVGASTPVRLVRGRRSPPGPSAVRRARRSPPAPRRGREVHAPHQHRGGQQQPAPRTRTRTHAHIVGIGSELFRFFPESVGVRAPGQPLGSPRPPSVRAAIFRRGWPSPRGRRRRSAGAARRTRRRRGTPAASRPTIRWKITSAASWVMWVAVALDQRLGHLAAPPRVILALILGRPLVSSDAT